MRHKPRNLVFGILGLLIILFLAWAWFSYHRAENAVARYKSRKMAAGEKFTVDELLISRPPPDSNGVPLFQQAVSLWRPSSLLETNPVPSMRMVAPGKAMIGWAQPDIRTEATNTWEEAESSLASEVDALKKLETLTEHPVLDFGLDYGEAFNLLLPHLAPLKRATQRLLAAAVCDLHRGRTDAACQKLRSMLALVQGLGSERLIISQLVRIAMAQITVTGCWELLQAPGVTDEQLASLQNEWSHLDFLRCAEDAMLMERAMGEESLRRMRNSSAEFRRQVSMSWAPGGGGTSGPWYEQVAATTVTKTKESLWRFAWSYPDQLRGLQGKEVLIEAIRALEKEPVFKPALDQSRKQLRSLGINPPSEDSEPRNEWFDLDVRSISSQSVLSLERVLYRLLMMEEARQLTLTAMALQRHRLQHGSYPEDLAALVPTYLPVIPADPGDGRPLRYRRAEDGTFYLYSVGQDGVDQGGDSTSPTNSRSISWQRGRDMVWPRPSTTEENAVFYQKQLEPKR